MQRHSLGRLAVPLIAALAMTAGTAGNAAAAQAEVAKTPQSATLTGPCLNPTARSTVEEERLSVTLADNADPAKLQAKSFATQMIEGAGFQDYGPQLVDQLCGTRSLDAARRLAVARGKALWTMATDRAQRKVEVKGSLPYSDDRPLYWTRLQAEAALQQWMPRFVLTDQERTALVTSFDKAARGMFSIDFPAGPGVKRMITSGFDPYILDGGQAGAAPGAVGNNLRHGNPSGALALALDKTSYTAADGTRVFIQSYALPVNFPQFQQGYLEDTVGPFMRPGPRQISASVTISQAGGDQFDLEQWNGRYHGTLAGNDNLDPCPEQGGTPQLPGDNPQCDTQVVPAWGGPAKFDLHNPPQWTSTTLPVATMINSGTGRNVQRPPGDSWPDPGTAFGVVWHTNYIEFPDCRSAATVTRNTPVPTTYPPATPPVPPTPGSCAFEGGGGNYLSNESGYRNTLLRDRMRLNIPAGHIHTPDMQHFSAGNLYDPSDATFDAWRLAIVAQGRQLVDVVAASTVADPGK